MSEVLAMDARFSLLDGLPQLIEVAPHPTRCPRARQPGTGL